MFNAPAQSGGVYTAPPGDFSSLIRLADGSFQRTKKDQTVELYNTQHKLISSRDPNGNETRYVYDANNRISKIIDPAGLETNFTLTGNRVSAITDPAGRVTRMEYDVYGNLTKVTDPDGTSRTWGYDDGHHMTSEINQRGGREQSFYDFAGRASHSIHKDGTEVHVSPVQVQGLYRPEELIDPLNSPLASFAGAQANYFDENGNVTNQKLDLAGQLVSATDGIGILPSVNRGNQNLVSSTTDARGNSQTYEYDERGNLIQINDLNVQDAPPTGLFPEQAYQTGDYPSAFVLKDFNHDGYVDMVTSNISSNISILLGQADGSFGSRTDYFSGDRSSALEAGDFNHDGHLDLATTTYRTLSDGSTESQVSILLGNGDGSFIAPTNFAVGTRPISIAIDDLNKDGNLDLVTANADGNSISVLLGNADGTFGNRQDFNTGGSAKVAIADIDGDGNLDLVSYNGTVSVLKGRGDGSFLPSTLLLNEYVYTFALSDVNRDGKIDIVTLGSYGNISVWSRQANGGFARSTSMVAGTPISSLTIADLNRDGNVDIVGAGSTNSSTVENHLTVFSGDGKNNFKTAVDYAVKFIPNALAVADLDRDGYLDLAALSSSNSNASVFLGNGNYTFDIPPISTYFSGGYNVLNGVALGDLNGDGDLDLVVSPTRYSSSDRLSIRFGLTGGAFADGLDLEAISRATSVTLKDINADGFLDILTTNYNQSASVWVGNGNGTFSSRTDYATGIGSNSLVTADLNGDGVLDLVVATDDSQSTLLIGKGDGTFTEAYSRNYTVGTYPTAMATGDLNGDNRSDMLVINRDSQTLSVLTSNIDGSFTVRPNVLSYPVDPNRVVLGDLDGDGKLDVVVTSGNQAFVALGQGNGSFSSKTAFSTSYFPTADLSLGDVNSDGILDIITTEQYNNGVSIFLGQGDGTFGNRTSYDTLSSGWYRGAYSLSLKDFDSDDHLDIFTTDPDGQVSQLYGNGNGTFTSLVNAYHTAAGVSSLVDLNGDGELDLISANPSRSGPPQVALGNGDGTFQDSTLFFTSTNPYLWGTFNSLAVGDLNEDGKQDAVTVITFAEFDDTLVVPQVVLQFGNGDGTFTDTPTFFAAGTTPGTVNLADLDGDGHLDLVLGSSVHNPTGGTVTHAVTVLKGKGDGTFNPGVDYSVGADPVTVKVVDLNQDGHLDIVSTNQADNSVSVLTGIGDSTFNPATNTPVGLQPVSIAIGDIDHDGHLDLITANKGDQSVTVLHNNGNNTFTATTPIAIGIELSLVELADVDGDGNLDIVTGKTGASDVTVLMGRANGSFSAPHTLEGNLITAHQPSTNPQSVGSIDLTDLNQDGILDLLVGNPETYQVSVHLGKGNGTFLTNPNIGARSTGLTTVDLNKDGHLDLVSTNSDDNSITILLGKGDRTYAPATKVLVGNSPSAVTTGDVNGDSHLDLLVANSADNTVSVLLGNGTGRFTPAQNVAVGHNPQSVSLSDVNGDGKLDLLVTNADDKQVSVLLGKGDATFAPVITPPSLGYMPRSIVTGDLNRDGLADFVAADPYNTISVSLGVRPGESARSVAGHVLDLLDWN